MEKKKKVISEWCKGVAVVVFAVAAISIVYGGETSCYIWLFVAFWQIVCGVLLLNASGLIDKSVRLGKCCDYKDGIIEGLYEQRIQLYEKIALLTDKCNTFSARLKMKDKNASEAAGEMAVNMEAEECCNQSLADTSAARENMEINITVTPDKAIPSMDTNLYIQPKDEFSRWWKIRGYDTELSKPDKEYYIYIRLAHKGFDGELRFLSKSRLTQNEIHRFVQVGTISPVVDGQRSVSYSLDGFRFKQIKKGKK